MIEEIKSYENYLRGEHWPKPGVKKAISEFLGSTVLDWESWGPDSISSEYLGLANRHKLQRLDKVSPAEIIEPEEFKQKYYDYQGQFELHNSLWQRTSEIDGRYPRRTLLVWDIELFDQNNPLSPIDNPEDTFNKLETIYDLFKQKLAYYGIDYQAVVSGRGYNFITSVSDQSGVLDELLSISGNVEETVLGKQKYPNPNLKRQKPVPEIAERLHVATVRLQQFLFNEIIRKARELQPLEVQISDKGEYGIAFDNTSMQFSIENRSIGSLATPYFIKMEKTDPNYVRTIIKILRSNCDFELTKEELIAIRSNYDLANTLFGDTDCRVPEGFTGIKKLIKDYKRSDLYKFHKIMDESFGDHPDDFNHGYRNYEHIANQTQNPEYIKYLLNNANDELLKPENLDYLIWEVFKAWHGSKDNLEVVPHIAGLLRSIYEDPRFEWGTRFTKNDAQRYARGWVISILGQMFEK